VNGSEHHEGKQGPDDDVDPAEVDPTARRGPFWRRMIDQLGGLDDAIEYAKGQAGLGADAKTRVRDQAPGFLELLAGLPEEARMWMASASPMAEGESAVVVRPFALALR